MFAQTLVREDPVRHRLVAPPGAGLGQVDWRSVVDALYEGGFDAVRSVEQ